MASVDQEYLAVADAVRRQDRPGALNLAARALKRGSKHPLVLVLAAEGLEERGEAAPAINLLRAATAAAPQHRVAWMRLAALLARLGRYEEALTAFDAVLALDPDHYAALMGSAEMRLLLRDYEGAETRYRRAAEVDPRAARPLAVLAVMAAQQRNVVEARALAERAAALAPGILGSELAVARADLLEGEPGLTVERLTRLLERTDYDDENRAGVHDVRAEALDALGRADEAFADYEARNALLMRVHAPRIAAEAIEGKADGGRRLNSLLASAEVAEPRLSTGEDTIGRQKARGHVFLVGFPRSGTTLLEKVLGGHPDAVALEEINHLVASGVELVSAAGWPKLQALTRSEADACRTTYWRLVNESLGDLEDKILVDKLPLHTLELPLIATLFPDARILFAVRDPRDVVLSCFRRRFQVNAAMFEFLTLAGAADFYDATMSLAMTARSKLPLNLREVRHETVIADFDREVGEILEFMGADWNPEVRNFAERVAGPMRTPSYAQLARGLNAGGVGQWRRYERHLQPVLGMLEPWVGHFGYPP
jgi:tetratricopeptide (TPR) repeat protein